MRQSDGFARPAILAETESLFRFDQSWCLESAWGNDARIVQSECSKKVRRVVVNAEEGKLRLRRAARNRLLQRQRTGHEIAAHYGAIGCAHQTVPEREWITCNKPY